MAAGSEEVLAAAVADRVEGVGLEAGLERVERVERALRGNG